MNQLDEDHSLAVDGADGGVYPVANVLEIGGAGLRVSGPFVSSLSTAIESGGIVVTGDSTFHDEVTFEDAVGVETDLAVNQYLTVGDTLYSIFAYITYGEIDTIVTINLEVQDDLDVAGDILIGGKLNGTGGTVIADQDFQVEGNHIGAAHFTGTIYTDAITSQSGFGIAIGTNVAVSGNLEATGATRTPWRKLALPNSDVSIDGADYNLLIAFSGTISTTHDYTITTDGAVDGDWFWVANRDGSTENLNINPTLGDVSTIQNNAAALYVYDSVLGWKIVKYFAA